MKTENNSTREEWVKATLLAYNEGPVWRVGDQIITGMGADRFIFPSVPENLYSKPTLVWMLSNQKAGEHTVEASYLTNQINWNSDYVLTVAADQKLDLNKWVTVVNNSGTAFKNAMLQLVAGELHRVYPQRDMAMEGRAMKAMAAPAAAQFAASKSRPMAAARTRTPSCRSLLSRSLSPGSASPGNGTGKRRCSSPAAPMTRATSSPLRGR
jgi:hypothetical protein